jgi:hypothetical protein
MLAPVMPVLQVIVPPVQPTAVKVAFSPSQHTTLSVLITGTGGIGFVPIIIVFEFPDVPQLVVHVAV